MPVRNAKPCESDTGEPFQRTAHDVRLRHPAAPHGGTVRTRKTHSQGPRTHPRTHPRARVRPRAARQWLSSPPFED
ncbi:hypothetical protein CU044_1208 [Streptomyces sp. L-9-10]|nr:hypothetical protein CU044_1208 [Streptomyces sp. L-9-10]